MSRQPRSTHWRAWSRAYGVDKRQARRIRRKFAKTGERRCTEAHCVLRGERPHAIHFSWDFGPFASQSYYNRKRET